MFVVNLKDGRTLKESEGTTWNDIKQHDITSLHLQHKHGKTFSLIVKGENVDKLLQLKRATIGTACPGGTGVHTRVIGFIVGDIAVKLEVDEKSGNSKLFVEKNDGKKWKRL